MTDRYFTNDGLSRTKPDYHAELLASLERINTYNPPVQTCSTGWNFSGFYQGPTSVAYLFYRLSQHYPDLEFKQQSLFEWAEAYLQLGTFIKKTPPFPSHCGIANETLASTALGSVLLNDASLVHKLCSYEVAVNDPRDDGSNEWLYGRAGYLYFLRLCYKHFGQKDANTKKLLIDTIAKTNTRITKVPLPWTWHGKQYTGAAHGLIGIILQAIASDSTCAPDFLELLPNLLQTQLPTGNFPSSLPASRDELIQFCHGAPGFVISLQSLKRLQILSNPQTEDLENQADQAIAKAQADTWKRGLLHKTPCLCHGIAGNALAFDDDERFDHFLSMMTTQSLKEKGWLDDAGHSDKFAGLYGGEAGRAWVWAVADTGLPRTCPGYNDI